MPLFLILILLSLTGCAARDAFHSEDLPEPLRPQKSSLVVNAEQTSPPYQTTRWEYP